MTLQEIFSKVATHLLKQKVKSFDSDAGCAYRGSNGTSCAVGCLIEDEHYDPEIEGKQVSSTAVRTALSLSGVPTDYETMQLLGKLQNIHDGGHPQNWPRTLQTLANASNLEMPK